MEEINIFVKFPHLMFLPAEEHKSVMVPISKIVGIGRGDIPSDFVGGFDRLFRDRDKFHRVCARSPIHLNEYRGKYYVGIDGNHRVIALNNIGHKYGITEVPANVTKFISTPENEKMAKEEYKKSEENDKSMDGFVNFSDLFE